MCLSQEEENGNMSRHSDPVVKQKLLECMKRCNLTLAVGTFPYKWHRNPEHWAMYGKKCPCIYSFLSKQYLPSQNNVDAVCWYSVF